MKKKWKRSIAAVLTAGMFVNITGCVSIPMKESLPEDTIEAYEDACNAMDIQGMLDCIDEKTVKSMTAGMDVMMGLLGAATGVDLGIEASDLIDMAPLLQGIMGEYVNEAGGMPQVDFQVTETYIKGKKATVYFTEVNSGTSEVINMVKEDGQWYMTLSTTMISKEDADRVIIAGEAEKEKKAEAKGEDNLIKSFSEMDLLERIVNAEKLKEAIREILGGSAAASSSVETKKVERTDTNGNTIMKEVPIIHLTGFPGGKDVYLDEFGIGEKYPNSFTVTIDGESVYLAGAECIGFVRYAQKKLYGEFDSPGSSDTAAFKNILGGNTLSSADLEKDNYAKLKEVITQAGPGAHIRTDGKQHSMMVAEVTDEGFTIIHANGDGKGTIKRETFSWKEYGDSWGKRGISYLKVHQAEE